jgi:hypothetical protein
VGGTIDFSITVPKPCERGGCGLIFDVPGFFVSADQVDQNTGLRERARNLENPFIVVNPQKPNPGQRPGSEVNSFDLAFRGGSADEIFDFMKRAAQVFRVDSARIHIGGFSQGGFVTFNFLCDPQKAAFIASAAPHAATQPRTDPCFGTASGMTNPRVPILFLTGRMDLLVPPPAQFATADAIVAGLRMQDRGLVAMGRGGFEQRRFTGPNGALLETIRWDNIQPVPIADPNQPNVSGVPIGGHCYVGPVVGNQFSCDGLFGFEHGQKVLDFYIANPKRTH